MRLYGILGSLLVVSFLTCGVVSARPEAEALADVYFTARSEGDLDRTLSLYSDLFFEATPRSEWTDSLLMLEHKLGRPSSHEQREWNVYVGSGPAGTGTYVTLNYDVQYAKYPAQERFRFFTSIMGGPTEIIFHHVDSPGLL